VISTAIDTSAPVAPGSGECGGEDETGSTSDGRRPDSGQSPRRCSLHLNDGPDTQQTSEYRTPSVTGVTRCIAHDGKSVIMPRS